MLEYGSPLPRWLGACGFTVLAGLLVGSVCGCEGSSTRDAAVGLEGTAASSAVPIAGSQPASPAPAAGEEPEPEPVFDPAALVAVEPVVDIDSPKVYVLSCSMAKVAWTTAYESDSEILWGATDQLEGVPVLQPDPTLNHCVLLRGLEPGRAYWCRAVSRTGDGNESVSELLSFRTYSAGGYTVRSKHPRIFFTSDDLPRLKDRIQGAYSRDWEQLVRACQSALSKSDASLAASPNNFHYARALAFAGLLGDNRSFRQKAISVSLTCAREALTGSTMDMRRRTMAIAVVYDWIYSYLSSSARGELRNALVKLYDRLENGTNGKEYVWGHSHGHQRPMLLAALALHGEVPEAAANLQKLVEEALDGYLATWRNYGDEGGSLKGWWYTTWTLNMEVESLSALSSATGRNWFEQEPWFEKLLDWYILALRGDGTFCRSGDSRIGEGIDPLDRLYALSLVHNYRNPQAKWLVRQTEKVIGRWTLLNFYDILWDDPDVEAMPPAGKLSRLFRTPGQVLMRTSWDENSVVATFRSASDYTLGHTHRDNNSFTLYYRGGLALDSGIYDAFAGSHHRNYYTRTIAHNSILVMDPAERFVLYGDEYANDGGQRWLSPLTDVPSSFPASTEQVLDPSAGYTAGGIVRYEDTDEYSYSLGDAAPSYSAAKLRAFDRHFLWLKRAGRLAHPVVVVLDRVVSTDASFKKTYLLHTQNRPAVSGAVVRAANGEGALYQKTLLPESPRIEVVGGSGREFWVGGKNYAPSRSPSAKEEAGAYRVEVSPSAAHLTDCFLHVLYAGDAGGDVPDAARLSTSAMAGLSVEDWLIVFAGKQDGTKEVAYHAPAGSARHLLIGMLPEVEYDVLVDGTSQARVVASRKGTIRFDADGPGDFELRRAAMADVAAGPGAATDTDGSGGEIVLDTSGDMIDSGSRPAPES